MLPSLNKKEVYINKQVLNKFILYDKKNGELKVKLHKNNKLIQI